MPFGPRDHPSGHDQVNRFDQGRHVFAPRAKAVGKSAPAETQAPAKADVAHYWEDSSQQSLLAEVDAILHPSQFNDVLPLSPQHSPTRSQHAAAW